MSKLTSGQIESKRRSEFASIKLSDLTWEKHYGIGNRPDYTEAILDEDHFGDLIHYSNFAHSPYSITVSIRKYPLRYFVALIISPDPYEEMDEVEYTQDGEGDGLIPSLADQTVSIIIYRIDHLAFENNLYTYLSDLWNRLKAADFEALHTSAICKAIRGSNG